MMDKFMLQNRARQVIILFVVTLGFFLVTYTWQYPYTQFYNEQERPRLPDILEVQFNLETNDRPTLSEGLVTDYDVRDVPCDDIKKMTSARKSKMYISENEFSLGDQIRIALTAFDEYGQAKTNGGDEFRAAMKIPDKQAYTNGIVTDYDNGTYGITFEALWTGNATIEVTLAYTKETFAVLYRLRLKNYPLVHIGGKYNHNGVIETVLCDLEPKMLASYHICDENNIKVCSTKLVTPKQHICNFTSWNDGFPLFCARPKLKSLRCNHLKIIGTSEDFGEPIMTACEQMASEGTHQRLENVISVAISPNKERKNDSVIHLSQASCANYSRKALWSTNKPSGFFFQGRWHLRHCKGVDLTDKQFCLKDRHLYIIGDSTMRQWYLDIIERYNCSQFTEKWTKRKWYDVSSCRNLELNFTTTYTIHGLPFNLKSWDNITTYLTSIAQRMDNIPDNENAVFVFHMYQHMIYYHPRYFKLKMEAVSLSAERLFDRNKYVKVMIKGPHVYMNNRDVFCNLYTRILYEVFHNLHDRVIFLDNKDATMATEETNIHPQNMVVEAMVDQMIVFACN